MIWQDAVVSLASIFMIFGLIPSVRGSNKPALKTSLITSFWIFVICFVYLTLGLYLAAILLGIQGILWSTLAYQAFQSGKMSHV